MWERDRLHKRSRNNTTLYQRYKIQRNKVNNMVNHAKEQFYVNANELLDTENQNPKSYWKLVKMLTNKGNLTSNIPPLRNFETNRIPCDDKI